MKREAGNHLANAYVWFRQSQKQRYTKGQKQRYLEMALESARAAVMELEEVLHRDFYGNFSPK